MSNRRLFSFRLSTLLLAVTAIALALGAPHLYRQIQFWRLQSYVGRDLRKLMEDEQKTFNSIVESVLAPPKRPVFDTFENWFVWQVPTDRGERIVLFQASRLWMIPGNSHARLYFFDRTGRRVGESMFQVGYRIDIEDAALITDKFHGESLLQIKSTPSINGADIATQYYSLSHNRCDLLRLEDSQGALIANAYSWQHWQIGPPPVEQTERAWIDDLSAARETQILRALIWIAGEHTISQHPGQESPDQAKLHQGVCQNSATRPAIESLMKHRHAWVAEAAKEAMRRLPAGP
jgi:hypothetical protein